jgi:hypothetical protein
MIRGIWIFRKLQSLFLAMEEVWLVSWCSSVSKSPIHSSLSVGWKSLFINAGGLSQVWSGELFAVCQEHLIIQWQKPPVSKGAIRPKLISLSFAKEDTLEECTLTRTAYASLEISSCPHPLGWSEQVQEPESWGLSSVWAVATILLLTCPPPSPLPWPPWLEGNNSIITAPGGTINRRRGPNWLILIWANGSDRCGWWWLFRMKVIATTTCYQCLHHFKKEEEDEEEFCWHHNFSYAAPVSRNLDSLTSITDCDNFLQPRGHFIRSSTPWIFIY